MITVKQFLQQLSDRQLAKRLSKKARNTKTIDELVNHEGNDHWLADELKVNATRIIEMCNPKTELA